MRGEISIEELEEIEHACSIEESRWSSTDIVLAYSLTVLILGLIVSLITGSVWPAIVPPLLAGPLKLILEYCFERPRQNWKYK